jgi:hypothetical protein
MTVFDLLFLAAVLGSAVLLVLAGIAFCRGRRARAVARLTQFGALVVVYLAALILVSLVSPRRVLHVGEEHCWDDWCITVTEVRRRPAGDNQEYAVTFRVSSRARRVAQRERGVQVYLMDDCGGCYEPEPDPEAVPFDVLLRPQQSVTTTRVFHVPADAHDPVLVVTHGGGFPGLFIIGDSESLFHKCTVVRLE